MGSATVRVSHDALAVLHELARAEGISQQSIVERALESYRRLKLLEATNAAFAAWRADPEAWKDEQGEREAWDRASSIDAEARE
jgi:predicted transcriptional regulator